MAALLVAGSVGCSGSINDASAPRPGDSTPGTGSTPGNVPPPGGSGGQSGTGQGGGTGIFVPPDVTPATPADPNGAGTMPFLRMTRREYNNTVRDLLGDSSNPADAFPLDRESDFLYRRAGTVSLQDLDTLRDAAQNLATPVEAKAQTLAPCAAGADEAACAKKFIAAFGLRAFRRPLTTEETNRLVALYQAGRTTLTLSYAGAIRLLVEGMLQSPAFLYHWELGYSAPTVEGNQVRLGAYEVASRLSYFLWSSMPDQTLFDAAAAGKLSTPAELEDQARRMLADDKARQIVAAFAEEWLNLDQVAERPKDPAIYPEWKDDLKAAMTAELDSFIESVTSTGDGKLSSLLTATNTFVNQPLAALYGVSGVTGAVMKPMTLDPAQRSGLLTRAGFLTVTGATDGSHPVKRGRRIYERLLCGQLPPPPNDVPLAAGASAGGTTRQRFEVHDKNDCARACHSVMDKLGFAFEHYDGIGKYRTMDNGGVVDSSGSIELDGKSNSFSDARDMSQLLAGSPTAARCFATQWMRYTFKRFETEADRASLDAIATALHRGNSIRDMLVALAGTRSFRYRTPATGEKLQ